MRRNILLNRWVLVLLCVVLVLFVGLIQWSRPLPALVLQVKIPSEYVVPGKTVSLHFPSVGQSAVYVENAGFMGNFGSEQPTPIASVTKVMTALLVLEKHPLSTGEDGPLYHVTATDVNLYLSDLSKGESTAKVQVGERLSERQLLEGLLLPSANNFATMLGRWESGSDAAFIKEMNQKAKALGLTHTTYADESGFSPQSRSTAKDQAVLFQVAMRDAVFRSIVALHSANLPVAGVVHNVNRILGQQGIIGGKTGNTSQAGGCFVFAMEPQAGGQHILVTAAVFGQTGRVPLDTALNVSKRLAADIPKSIVRFTPVQAGMDAGYIKADWAQQDDVLASQTASFNGWPDMRIRVQLEARQLGEAVTENRPVAWLELRAGGQSSSVPLYPVARLVEPGFFWRVTRLVHS